jgi:toxin FitB
MSVLTLGEICKGIGGLPASTKRADLQYWFYTVMRPWFAGRVLSVTAPIAERWGFLAAEAKSRGTPLSVVDGLLAATAVEHGLTIVTRNMRDFAGVGVGLLNPWEDA